MNASASSTPDPVIDTEFVRRWLSLATSAIEHKSGWLTELDSAIGDADHGINMHRGFTAASAAVEKEPSDTPGEILTHVGRQLISSVGGAAGPLYGTLLRRAGKALGDQPTVSAEELRVALRSGIDAVAQLGRSERGDKTMLDSLYPAVEAMGLALGSGSGLVAALTAARTAADEGAAATVPMLARKGRASYLGERSIGHQDPGATSAALLIAAFAEAAGADTA
ncbi:dihydroxyacetone kinase subunit DhaL [Streptantibioticus ferralitis]|uniref:Dihydroxyacetone kinase subunit DhaL n=1 Tax=Streptantibioticus ferralitis TaxID=236510 RepID=A0ABT5YXI8_9ACTN|nr:dihydroxyacetone kinase subunit DhaL [Streptantibioticus ferralitis]MDF2256309.1 dihydroxyacetone kinase subunit DhaL [Streptantibioticus ferralitis]